METARGSAAILMVPKIWYQSPHQEEPGLFAVPSRQVPKTSRTEEPAKATEELAKATEELAKAHVPKRYPTRVRSKPKRLPRNVVSASLTD